jgi:hypothetical protein
VIALEHRNDRDSFQELNRFFGEPSNHRFLKRDGQSLRRLMSERFIQLRTVTGLSRVTC